MHIETKKIDGTDFRVDTCPHCNKELPPRIPTITELIFDEVESIRLTNPKWHKKLLKRFIQMQK